MKRLVIYVLLLSLLGGSVMVAWHHARLRSRTQASEEGQEDATESRDSHGRSRIG